MAEASLAFFTVGKNDTDTMSEHRGKEYLCYNKTCETKKSINSNIFIYKR